MSAKEQEWTDSMVLRGDESYLIGRPMWVALSTSIWVSLFPGTQQPYSCPPLWIRWAIVISRVKPIASQSGPLLRLSWWWMVSFLTDRWRYRYGYVIFGVVFASIGYIILLCQAFYLEGWMCMSATWQCSSWPLDTILLNPVAIVWIANNLSGNYKRAVGLAIQVGFGNIGGIIASNIFNRDDAPLYTVGYGVSLAMIMFCWIMSTIFAAGLLIENKKRYQGKRDDRLQLDEDVLNGLGDDDPRFRFSLWLWGTWSASQSHTLSKAKVMLIYSLVVLESLRS